MYVQVDLSQQPIRNNPNSWMRLIQILFKCTVRIFIYSRSIHSNNPSFGHIENILFGNDLHAFNFCKPPDIVLLGPCHVYVLNFKYNSFAQIVVKHIVVKNIVVVYCNILFLHNREKPLAFYIFSNNPAMIEKLLESVSSGGTAVNDCLMQAGGKNKVITLSKYP